MAAPIFIPFGPFEPDVAVLNSGASQTASGVHPGKYAFLPALGVNSTASAIGLTDCAGACLIKTSTSAYRVYAHKINTGTHSIRSFDSASFGAAYTGTEVGTGYAAPDSGEYWRFAKFGNFLIAVQDNVDPQVLNWSSAGSFGTLGGSPPRATGVFTIEDFVFLTGLASNRRKLQWSAIGDHTGWTVGTNLSDEQEFPDGEDICGIAGGKSGFVIQKQAIRSYQFLPGDTTTIFQFQKLDGIPGCVGLYAWTMVGQTLYYLSEEGFCSIGPQGFRRIGAHRVDEQLIGSSTAKQITAIADPFRPVIRFALPTASGWHLYDYLLDQWTKPSTPNAQFLIDHLEATGGEAQMMVQFSDSKLYTLDGSNVAATMETPFFHPFGSGPNAGKRSTIQAIRPITNGAPTSVQVSSQETPWDTDSSTDYVTYTGGQSNGKFDVLKDGLYHKVKINWAAAHGASWIRGFEIWVTPSGEA